VTEAPATGVLVRYLLENPWPLCTVLALVALLLLHLSRERDDRRFRLAALVMALVGIGAWLLSWSVDTPGERAVRVVEAFVAAAEEGRVRQMREWLAPDASLHYGALTAPGMDRAELDRSLSQLEDRHRIESNSITKLRAGAVDDATGVAELGCLTTTRSSFGPVPSLWLFRVERQDDGRWLIRRIAAISIAGRPAEPSSW